MEYHNKSAEDALRELGTDGEEGLSSAEAEKRLAQFGANKLAEKKKKSTLRRFLNNSKT